MNFFDSFDYFFAVQNWCHLDILTGSQFDLSRHIFLLNCRDVVYQRPRQNKEYQSYKLIQPFNPQLKKIGSANSDFVFLVGEAEKNPSLQNQFFPTAKPLF